MNEDRISRARKGKRDVRAERLAAALRENLRRRKSQARGRADVKPERVAIDATSPARGKPEKA
jgi:hypothetical protein